MGLKNAMLGSFGNEDFWHVLENILYFELIRRGYDVYVGKVDNLEVDFVAQNAEGLKYIQVSASVRDLQTLKRGLPTQEDTGQLPQMYNNAGQWSGRRLWRNQAIQRIRLFGRNGAVLASGIHQNQCPSLLRKIGSLQKFKHILWRYFHTFGHQAL